MISIHTPTKGATGYYPNICPSGSQFQSTLPRRERPACRHTLEISNGISIHTPTKGATSLNLQDKPMQKFQSTLPRRERLVTRFHLQLTTQISIHTPTKGATAILTNNFLIFCSISLINFILYLQIIQILFIVRYKFIFYFIF